MNGAKVIGIGRYLPKRIITNADLAKEMLALRAHLCQQGYDLQEDPNFECDAEWVRKRTGIECRRRAGLEEATSDLAAAAAREALKNCGLKPEALQFVLVATVTPDHPASPSTAALVHGALGLQKGVFTVDITSACTSFVSALQLGHSLIRSGQYRCGLVIGADTMSRISNPYTRSMWPLLGDGAGALILERTENLAECQFGGGFSFGTKSELAHLIRVPTGGSRLPIDITNGHQFLNPKAQDPNRLVMEGQKVYREAITLLSQQIIPQALASTARYFEEVDAIFLHDANARITEAVFEKIGYRGPSTSRIKVYGNTSSASLPLALYDALMAGVIRPGQLVLLVAFGGGFSWGTVLWQVGNLCLSEDCPELAVTTTMSELRRRYALV